MKQDPGTLSAPLLQIISGRDSHAKRTRVEAVSSGCFRLERDDPSRRLEFTGADHLSSPKSGSCRERRRRSRSKGLAFVLLAGQVFVGQSKPCYRSAAQKSDTVQTSPSFLEAIQPFSSVWTFQWRSHGGSSKSCGQKKARRSEAYCSTGRLAWLAGGGGRVAQLRVSESVSRSKALPFWVGTAMFHAAVPRCAEPG